jgi:hypothetical protein
MGNSIHKDLYENHKATSLSKKWEYHFVAGKIDQGEKNWMQQ